MNRYFRVAHRMLTTLGSFHLEYMHQRHLVHIVKKRILYKNADIIGTTACLQQHHLQRRVSLAHPDTTTTSIEKYRNTTIVRRLNPLENHPLADPVKKCPNRTPRPNQA